MNTQQTLDTIEPEVIDRLSARRAEIDRGATASPGLMAALALGSVPIALAALSRDVFGQAPTTVRGVLEFAYVLENLEAEFYKAVLGSSATAAQNTAFAPVRAAIAGNTRVMNTLMQIRKHEIAHVAFLKAAITAAGGNPITYTGAEFDFTGGNGAGNGPFLTATTDSNVLLAAAQAFEDTGVRAYKGQVDKLMGAANRATLTAALRIHSVEARHAAQIRRLRGIAANKAWITNAESNIAGLNTAGTAVVARVYQGEDNTTHAGANISSLGNGNGGVAAVTEAFDEPLTYDDVIFIVKDFIIGANP